MTEPQAPPHSPSDDAGPPRPIWQRVIRGSSTAVLIVVATIAGLLIALLVGAAAYTQIGPGGILSSIRPGSPAPEFELPTLDGESTIRLADYRGRPVAVNFWATWCRGCVKELPALAEAESRHADDGLAVIAVNAGQLREHVQLFLADRGIELNVAHDIGRVLWRQFRIAALPTTVWVDRQGIVRAVELGELTPELIDKYVALLVSFDATGAAGASSGD